MKKLLLVLSFLFLSINLYSQEKSYVSNEEGEVVYTLTSEDGVVIEKGTYWLGKKSGNWYWYHKDGSLQAIATFKNGKREGKWKFYSKEGLLVGEVVYKDNRRVSASLHKDFDNS